jgi:hypothetical protein
MLVRRSSDSSRPAASGEHGRMCQRGPPQLSGRLAACQRASPPVSDDDRRMGARASLRMSACIVACVRAFSVRDSCK